MRIKVVGQDPSMNNWGLAAAYVDLETFEIDVIEIEVIVNLKKDISTNKNVRRNSLDIERTKDLNRGIQAFLNKHDPVCTMIEVPHGAQSFSSGKGMGICLGLLGAQSFNMIQLSERECKISAIGKNKGTKKEVIEWAMGNHPNANWKMKKSNGVLVSTDGYNEHAADAVAAINAGLLTDQFMSIAAIYKKILK